MNKNSLWSKDFILMTFMFFLLALIFFLTMTTFSIYALNHFGASESQAGFVASIYVIGAVISRLFAGRYIDLIGRKKMIVTGLLLFSIVSVFYFFSDSLSTLFVVRFLHGFAFGAAATGISTSVMTILPVDRRGEGMGYFSLSLTLATAVGPFLGSFLTNNYPFYFIFIICAFCSFLSFFISFFLKVPEFKTSKEEIKNSGGFFEKNALPISLFSFGISFIYSSILTFINAYSVEINLIAAASYFFIIYAFVSLIFRPIAGKIFDKYGSRIVVLPSFISLAIGFFLFSVANSSFIFLLAGFFISLGHGVFTSIAQVMAVNASPSNRIGSATSTYFIFLETGMGIGPFILGSIIPFIGFRGLYEVLAVVLVAITFLFFFHRKYKK